MASGKICPNCGAELKDSHCEFCGYENVELSTRNKTISAKLMPYKVAYPEYFEQKFDKFKGDTISTFLLGWIYRDNGFIRINFYHYNEEMRSNVYDKKYSYYGTKNGSPIIYDGGEPWAGAPEYIVDEEWHIGYPRTANEISFFIKSDITYLKLCNLELSKEQIHDLQSYYKAFLEAVDGDGIYVNELNRVKQSFEEFSMQQKKKIYATVAKRKMYYRIGLAVIVLGIIAMLLPFFEHDVWGFLIAGPIVLGIGVWIVAANGD